MIIVRDDNISLYEFANADSILFYLKDGTYFYVCSGIVDNELRILKNWETAERSSSKEPWLITYQQGCQIPQELGDYLVGINKNE